MHIYERFFATESQSE